MKQLTLPNNLNQTGKKIGSAKIPSQTMQKKWFNKPHQRTMVKQKCLSGMTKLLNINAIKKMTTNVSEKVSFENETFWREHTETFIKQGHFLCVAMLEKSDIIWKSYMFSLKKGPLKFLLNSCLDTLPTQTNLLQWGKICIRSL